VVVANEEGQIAALPAASWSDVPPDGPTWVYQALGSISAGMEAATRVDMETGRIQLYLAVPCEDNGLYCLDGASGTPRWIHRTRNPFNRAPQIAGSRIFACNGDRMHVLGLDDGPDGAGAGAPSTGGMRQALEDCETLYAADDRRADQGQGDRLVLRVDGRTGEPQAHARLLHFDKLIPAPDANVLVGLTKDGHIVAFR
jgi:outer membrane protein assembly factor BamB